MTPEAHDNPTRELLDRVRRSLPAGQVREVRMFGVVAVMVDDAMAVAAHRDGSLLLRVDPVEGASLLASPHASRAEMAGGRSMGEGWIRVHADALRTDNALDAWLRAAIRCLNRRKAAST